ncbi:hypothetical protein [Methylobacterium sp. J-070]|uniref:hypothetical protein n=1 Tax=Methylobacterium sp. J-070 TaxID=2836650 RepID=UPI001FB8A459|nr:hypothetical protein [Methylobacterium sp. J-070]MCJ2052923.1 hypothetical protein [Methylobacterium sp. J-070]
MADLAGPPGSGSRERAGPVSSPAEARRSSGGGLGRWLLDVLVVSFAYGGCIHRIHPNYIDFLSNLI